MIIRTKRLYILILLILSVVVVSCDKDDGEGDQKALVRGDWTMKSATALFYDRNGKKVYEELPTEEQYLYPRYIFGEKYLSIVAPTITYDKNLYAVIRNRDNGKNYISFLIGPLSQKYELASVNDKEMQWIYEETGKFDYPENADIKQADKLVIELIFTKN